MARTTTTTTTPTATARRGRPAKSAAPVAAAPVVAAAPIRTVGGTHLDIIKSMGIDPKIARAKLRRAAGFPAGHYRDFSADRIREILTTDARRNPTVATPAVVATARAARNGKTAAPVAAAPVAAARVPNMAKTSRIMGAKLTAVAATPARRGRPAKNPA